MGKLFLSYKIETLVEGIVKPGEDLKGKVFIRSEENKAQKLKRVGARIYEHYNEDAWEEDFQTKEYELVTQEGGSLLKEYEIFKADTKIEPGETKEFDFQIKLPSFPGRRKWGWYIALEFFQKGGLFSGGVKDEDEARCVLPVPGSTRMPSFGDIPGGPVEDPPRTAPPRPASRAPAASPASTGGAGRPVAPSRPSHGGSGMRCIKCHGTGQCSRCNGTGRTGSFACHNCNGSGKCDWCGGTGTK